MSGKREPITYKGRSVGILALTVAQLLIGTIHLLIGLGLLAVKASTGEGVLVYDIYTVFFGGLTILFAGFIWRGQKAGWFGTIAVSLFVIVADTFALLKWPTVIGIPSFAAPTEIAYSLVVTAYLFLPHVRRKFLH